MSVTYCHYCDKHVDLDFDSEHFDTELNTEALDYCVEVEQGGKNNE